MGMAFGISAGISPGPLLAVLISETLQHGPRAGFQIALAPLLSDGPIILLCLMLLSKMAAYSGFLTIITIIGAIYICYLGIASIRTKSVPNEHVLSGKRRPLWRGVWINLLNPHPYFFLLTVGAPLILKAGEIGAGPVLAFFLGFYSMLVSSKCIIAIITGTSRRFVAAKTIVWLNQIMGLVLIALAVYLLWSVSGGTGK